MRVLSALEPFDPIVEGGWGVDALVGEQTRSHADLDVAIDRAHLDDAAAALSELGYAHAPDVVPGLPARLVMTDAQGRVVDFHPLTFAPSGDGWQQLGERAWGLYPADGLTANGRIGDRDVRCATPELQLRHHLGYEWTDTDLHDLGLLRDRFGIWLPL